MDQRSSQQVTTEPFTSMTAPCDQGAEDQGSDCLFLFYFFFCTGLKKPNKSVDFVQFCVTNIFLAVVNCHLCQI